MTHEFAKEGLYFKYGKHMGINPESYVDLKVAAGDSSSTSMMLLTRAATSDAGAGKSSRDSPSPDFGGPGISSPTSPMISDGRDPLAED